MSGSRQLWTGPYGEALADRALDTLPVDPTGYWIVPSDLARERAVRRLALRAGGACRLRVGTWDDLWREVRSRSASGPACLSPASARAVLVQAIAEAGRAGRLTAVGQLAETAGFRRRVRERIAHWTRAEHDPAAEPPGPGDVVAAEWAVFGVYRALLKRLDAADDEALAAWASWTLLDDPPPDLRRFGYVGVLDPVRLSRPAWRALRHFRERAAGVLVTLPLDPSHAEAYEAVVETRERLLEWQFTETEYAQEAARPAALAELEGRLFGEDESSRPRIAEAEGLRLLGAPEGEGVAAVVVGRVRELLRDGGDPEEILALVPRRDDAARRIAEALRAWDLPVDDLATEPIGADPGLAALRLAMGLPGGGWETAALVRLLRHGRLRPRWLATGDPLFLPTAARAIVDTRVFRGREALREALARALGSGEGTKPSVAAARKVEAARVALAVLDGLIDALDPTESPASWRQQVARMVELAEALGLETTGDAAWESLLEAAREHGAVLQGLGRGGARWTWAEFAREVQGIAREVPLARPSRVGGAIRVVSVAEAEGVRARHVIVANLAEGTFPDRAAVAAAGREDNEEESPSLPLAREMLRFLRVVGTAEESLTLVYPSTDEKGHALLAAGFVEDVRDLLAPEARKACIRDWTRLDPLQEDFPAGTPAEERVRIVARACHRREIVPLLDLARSPSHRAALDGLAEALRVGHRRSRSRRLGVFDGQLADPRAIRRIAEDFSPERAVLSPSQLESLSLCPFQFFLRYVLRLEPTEERDELEEDYSARGTLLHRALEVLHRLIQEEGDVPLAERVDALAGRVLLDELEKLVPPASEHQHGLTLIERRRLEKVAQAYSQQFRRYAEKWGARAECRHLELEFGKDEASAYASLVLGDGGDAVRMQGKIDRLDVIRAGEETLVRVIDYKSGRSPAKSELASGLALQLPLYALAVERLILPGQGGRLLDMGYWALRDTGYRSIASAAREGDEGFVETDEWRDYRRRLESFVLALVRGLRNGSFPVRPRIKGCTSLCDYQAVCRIALVRAFRKGRDGLPVLEPAG